MQEYAFKSPRICFRGTNYEMLLTCILYCAPGPAAIRTICKYSRQILITDIIFCSRTIFLGKAIRLSRDILTFLAVIWSSLCFSCSIYRFIPPVVVLAAHDSNVAVNAQVCRLFCVFYILLCWKINLKFHVTLRSLIGLCNWIIKSDKSGRQAKTVWNVAGGKFTCGLAARMAAPPLARPLTNPASYAGYTRNRAE